MNFGSHGLITDPGTALQRASGLVLIANTPKGRGIFASVPIPSATIIDVCPVLVLSVEEVERYTSKTCLDHYTYTWPIPKSASISGHTAKPNKTNPDPDDVFDPQSLDSSSATSTNTASSSSSRQPSNSQSRPTPPPLIQTQAIALGLGSLFNHSRHHQNIGWRRSLSDQTIIYTSLRDIREGEELCISYGDIVWFEDADGTKAELCESEIEGKGQDVGDQEGEWQGGTTDEGGGWIRIGLEESIEAGNLY